MTSSTGESDSGPGASTPDEPLPGQTHDHPQRRNVTQRWTVPERQHSPLPHPTELFPLNPGCGGELSASTWTCVVVASLKGTVRTFLISHPSACVPSDRAVCFQSEHQRCVCAEVPRRPVCLAGRWLQWWGDGGCQSCGGLPGWQSQRGVWGRGARWVSSDDQYAVCHITRGRTNY